MNDTSTFKMWNKHRLERELIEWFNGLESILDAKITDDLVGSGQYLDDDIGDSEFISDVMIVKEQMALGMLDYYNDNINDIVSAELGSDFKGTI